MEGTGSMGLSGPLKYCYPRKSSFSIDPSILVNLVTLLIVVRIPAENVDSCCWMYSMNACDFGAQWSIFIISLYLNPANDSAHVPPD